MSSVVYLISVVDSRLSHQHTPTKLRLQSEEWQDVREDLIEDLHIRAENEARKAVIAQQSKTKRKVASDVDDMRPLYEWRRIHQ
jgi:hypothetical protein